MQKELLNIGNIVQRKLILVLGKVVFTYPEGFEPPFAISEIRENKNKNYLGYNIFSLDSDNVESYLCIQSEKHEKDSATELMLYALDKALQKGDYNSDDLCRTISNILDSKGGSINWTELEQNHGGKVKGYLVVVTNYRNYCSEVVQIIKNTVETVVVFEYQNSLIMITDEADIEVMCKHIFDNILLELLIECNLAIGGYVNNIKELGACYNVCSELLELRYKFDIHQCILQHDSMYFYRAISIMPDSFKIELIDKVFTPKFLNMLNYETEITIEEFFNNNLNLTDTANKLYVHRNTLLYRLERIQKYTGYDLRKFEDSLLFKIAWVAKKELTRTRK